MPNPFYIPPPNVGRDPAAARTPSLQRPGRAKTMADAKAQFHRKPSLTNPGGAKTVRDAAEELRRKPSLEGAARDAQGRFVGRTRGL
jgi:hypothetical protein